MDEITFQLVHIENSIRKASLNYDSCMENIVKDYLSNKNFDKSSYKKLINNCTLLKNELEALVNNHDDLISTIPKYN